MSTKRTGDPVWLELTSTDPDAAIAFYSGLFGWTADDPIAAFGGYRTLRLDGARVAGATGASPQSGWLVYLAVADAAAATAAVAPNGGTVIAGPDALGDLGMMSIVIDPSGARLGIWQPGTHPGFGAEDIPGAPTWFDLQTKDFAAAVPFYEAVLGWTTVSMGDSDEFRMVLNGENEEASAGIYDAARSHESDESVWMPYFAVADADATAARVRELGGVLLDDPVDTPFGRLAHAVDPTGAIFTLIRLPEGRS